MTILSKHKALIITSLIAAIIVLMVFNVHLSRNLGNLAETYYELEPEPEIKEEVEKELKETPTNTKKTNLAFNETEQFEDLDDDYLDKVREHYDKYAKATETKQETNQEVKDNNTSEELSSYQKINELLAAKNKNRQSTASNGNDSSEEISIGQGANRNSTMSYSLVGRTHNFLPTPIYLCQDSGKIVINITVNHLGKVTDTSVNGSSTSTNECLIDHALEYAQNARFSSDASKKTQIGTITFNFKGKN